MHDMDSSLISHEKYVLNKINEALDKISDGSYGICTNCHKKIEKDRLDVIPETTLCATCAKEIVTPPDESESMDKNPLNSYNDMYYSEYIKKSENASINFKNCKKLCENISFSQSLHNIKKYPASP